MNLFVLFCFESHSINLRQKRLPPLLSTINLGIALLAQYRVLNSAPASRCPSRPLFTLGLAADAVWVDSVSKPSCNAPSSTANILAARSASLPRILLGPPDLRKNNLLDCFLLHWLWSLEIYSSSFDILGLFDLFTLAGFISSVCLVAFFFRGLRGGTRSFDIYCKDNSSQHLHIHTILQQKRHTLKI